jgi:uncharacterized protein HemX
MTSEPLQDNEDIEDDVIEKKTKRKFPARFLLIILILALMCAAAYYHYLYQPTLKPAIVVNKTTLSQDNQSRIDALAEKQQQIIIQQNQLIAQLSRNNNSTASLQLSNIIFILQRAQLFLTANHDVATSLSLLQQARMRLESFHDQSFLLLKKSVNDDITRLNTIKSVDSVGLANTIETMIAQVNNLSFSDKQKIETPTKPEHYNTWWKKIFYQAWDAIASVVIVEKTEQRFTPLLSQEQLMLFKQYMQLLLQQAAWAVLNNNDAVFNQSLLQAKAALNHYVLPSNKPARDIEQSIDSLLSQHVTLHIPNSLDSLALAGKLQAKLANHKQEAA